MDPPLDQERKKTAEQRAVEARRRLGTRVRTPQTYFLYVEDGRTSVTTHTVMHPPLDRSSPEVCGGLERHS